MEDSSTPSDTPSAETPPVDKELCAKAAAEAALRQEGVVGMCSGIADRISMRKAPGVTVHVDAEGRVRIDLSLIVQSGPDLRQLGLAVQDAVMEGVQQATGTPVHRVNVMVADIADGP